LWSGQTISRLGDGLYQVALAWWVLEKTGSAAAMGTLFTLSFLPMILFLIAGGVVVDRLPRIRIMLASDIARGVLLGVIAGLAAQQQLALWHLYAAGLVFGFVNAFFQPAYAATLPQITPREALPSANALTDLSGQLAGVAGPALGALMVAAGGTAVAFGLDAFSFAISAACLLPLVLGVARPASPTPGATPQSTGVIHSLREGLKFVTHLPWLWITMLILSLVNLTGRSPMNVALPFLVARNAAGSVETLGLMYSLFSIGAVIGAVWMGRRQTIQRRGLLVYGGLACAGLLTLVIGTATTPAGMGIAVSALGVTLTITNLAWASALQEHVRLELLGRVSALNTLGSHALLPLGFGLAGWATDAIGAPLVFVIGGALMTGMATIGLIHPATRHLQ
ncbi:MAG: MFS transporter, partial [Chloroflexi bacterium]|nr:MFS transporter [Chloroflexota bacterium]